MKSCEKKMQLAIMELEKVVSDYSFVLMAGVHNESEDVDEDLDNFDKNGEALKDIVKQITRVTKRTIKALEGRAS